MLRKKLKKEKVPFAEFKFRGLDNTRIEALSDEVFALAVAFLLISSDFILRKWRWRNGYIQPFRNHLLPVSGCHAFIWNPERKGPETHSN